MNGFVSEHFISTAVLFQKVINMPYKSVVIKKTNVTVAPTSKPKSLSVSAVQG